MRKKIAIIGVVLLIVGVALYVGATEGLMTTTIVNTKMVQTSTGEWTSLELNTSSGSQLSLVTENSSYALVPSNDMSKINSGNVQNYAVSPKSELSTSLGLVSTFSPSAGSYYVVVFSKTTPSVKYTLLKSLADAAVYGLLVLAGMVLSIVGVIVLIVGLILRNKGMNEASRSQ